MANCTDTKPLFCGESYILGVSQLQTDVFVIQVAVPSPQGVPQAGQFFMIRSRPSAVFLTRPISVFRSYELNTNEHCIEFLVLKKGLGTQELCALSKGDSVDLIGPLGNTFTEFYDNKSTSSDKNIALIGGGIGVAPVAGFAETLTEKSYDFYGAFRSTAYGLDYIKPQNLYVCSDDGSSGTKGILPVIFAKEQAKNYSAVYACGPEAMLKYIQSICVEANVMCYLSLESHMACGVGACLGCTITTVNGNRRCCKDGPVFVGSEVVF